MANGMRQNHLLHNLAALLCLLGAISCTKDYSGRAIRFSASTRPDAAYTKTAFSGVVTSDIERIDWVAGDKIMLAMKNDDVTNSQMAYDITGISADGRYSRAGLEKSGGGSGGLQWGTGTHDFWAAYPSTATVGDHTITSNIPAVQTITYKTKTNNTLIYAPDMTKALMVAGIQSAPSGSGINLDFAPAFTTFDFTVGANSDVVITGFTMETITSAEASKNILSGDATATFDSSMACEYSATGSTGQSISTTFSPAAAISTTTSLNFKLFAVPSEIKGVTIAFTISSPVANTLRLRLKYSEAQGGDWLEFGACTKCNISGLLVPGAQWTITMDGPRVEQWTIVPEVVFGVE